MEIARTGHHADGRARTGHSGLEAPSTGHHAFGKALASDGALRHKGDACLRSPHRNLRLRRGPQNNPAANMQQKGKM